MSLHIGSLQDDAVHWNLKLSATNYSVNSSVCGKASKNASLSNGKKMTQLKNMRNEALTRSSGAADAWEGEDGSAGPVEPAVKKRRFEQQVVHVEVFGTLVAFLVPAKRPLVADLAVKMEAPMLSAVFQFLQADCEEQTSSRTYTRTGQYKKVVPEVNQEG